MLKTQVGREYWCIEQPDHGVVAGYLAAHWGNDQFTQPGYCAATADPESLRGEVVLGVAQHDNGWWEWEATPELSPVSGLPLDLMDVFQAQQEGMSRWRRGIPRFAETEGYRRWIHIGTPLTPNEMNNGNAAFPKFHSVYMDPESFGHYEET